MSKGQRTIAGLLTAAVVLLGLNLFATTTTQTPGTLHVLWAVGAVLALWSNGWSGWALEPE